MSKGGSVLSLSTFAFSSEWLLDALQDAVKAIPTNLAIQAALVFSVSVPTAIACRWVWLWARFKLRLRALGALPLPFFSADELKKRPSLKGHPLVVSMVDQESGGSVRPLLDCLETRDEKGKKRLRKLVSVGSSYLNGKASVMVYDREFFKEVTGDVDRFPKEKALHDIVRIFLGGDGLVTSVGSKWAKNRKALTPLFHFNALKETAKIMEKEGDKFVQMVLDKARGVGGDEKDSASGCCLVSPSDLKFLTLSVIVEASFGGAFDLEWMRRAWDELQELQQPMLTYGLLFGIELSPFLPFPSVLRFYQRRNQIISKVKDFVRERKEARNARKKDNETAKSDLQSEGSEGACNLVDQLLDSGVADDHDVTIEAFTFLFAGHDTTSTTLQWTLFELSCNPKVQEWMLEELVSLATWTTEGGRRVPSLPTGPEVLAGMERTKAVVREALRLWPPAPWLDRECSRDECLDQVKLPSGTHVLLNFWAAHRDPEVWGDDAEEFRPERHMESGSKSQYSLLPFSAGPRNCIGQKFAIQEAVVMVAKMLFHFQVDLSDEYREASLKRGAENPRDNVELVFTVTLEPRDAKFSFRPRVWPDPVSE